jgi:hypothetical protein
MLKQYAILSPYVDNKQVTTLFYDTYAERFRISIDKAANVPKLPISLKMHAERGRYELDEDFSMDWVRARVCPPSRHNISTILKEIGLSEYDEFGILMYTKGHSLMDDLFLAETGA